MKESVEVQKLRVILGAEKTTADGWIATQEDELILLSTFRSTGRKTGLVKALIEQEVWNGIVWSFSERDLGAVE